ncbi:MAG TPA: thiamine pyrophosphate-dependent enzyme, partial [Candidatus Dormibacteraeota bacterium]|nr:thiamine pyrophosphate-dependent enzyme [Candidatus Dormibacteraeota bacterium]
ARAPRWHGHFEGDPQRYRPVEELEEARRRDPVARLGRRLLAEGWADQGWLTSVTVDVEAEIAAAVAFAERSLPLELGAMLHLAGAEASW